MSLEANKHLIQRLIDEGHNRRDAAAAAAFYTEDASNHLCIVGRAGMKAVFETLYTVFPDFQYRILESTAEESDPQRRSNCRWDEIIHGDPPAPSD